MSGPSQRAEVFDIPEKEFAGGWGHRKLETSRPAVQVAARVAQPGGGGRSLGGAASVFPQTVGRHSYREGETTFFFSCRTHGHLHV